MGYPLKIHLGLILYPYHHGIEYILVGTCEEQLMFVKRGLHEGPFSGLKKTLSLIYSQEKIRNGRLTVGLSLSITQSLVLGNLAPSSTDRASDLPFVLAHLKQHLAEDLALLSVDFRRISDDRVWVLSCPREKIQEILSLNQKSALVSAIEPSINGLLRLLSQRFYSLTPQFYADETFAFLWLDGNQKEKVYRFSCFQGFQIIASETLPQANAGSSQLGQFLIACLQKYHSHWAKCSMNPLATTREESPKSASTDGALPTQRGGSTLQGYSLFLWIDEPLESPLVSTLERAFADSCNLNLRTITPKSCGLEHADEYAALGLALR
jgi:hypothetical protein